MVPVDQIRIGVPAGQCTEASIASLLEVPLAEVPDLYDPADLSRAGTFRALLRWLTERGLVWMGGPLARPIPAAELALPRDLPRVAYELTEGGDWTQWHLLLGVNPDGIGHCCVGWGGRLVHDPNPSRAGLVTVDEVAVLLPTARLARWPELATLGGAIWVLP